VEIIKQENVQQNSDQMSKLEWVKSYNSAGHVFATPAAANHDAPLQNFIS
jgi:hypothetical protein